MINYHTGDIFAFLKDKNNIEKDAVLLPHVVNVCNAMGNGFVLPLMEHFPNIRAKYQEFCALMTCEITPDQKQKYVYANKAALFGMVQYYESQAEYSVFGIDKKIIVANMFAQTLGNMQRALYYNKLAACMEDVAEYVTNSKEMENLDFEIVTIKFGSGLAGGKWEFIEELIKDIWLRRAKPIKVTVCVPQANSEPANLAVAT